MRIRNWRLKVAATLIACGACLSGVATAADLRTNLVVNPSFENVDTLDTGPFTAVRLLDWTDTDADFDDTYSYPYSSNYSGAVKPPGASDYHYTGGFNVVADSELITQEIDLSTGATGALIPGGSARYDLRAFFSSYLNQLDVTSVRATFLNASNVAVGSASIGGPSFLTTVPIVAGQRAWGNDAKTGVLPSSTRKVRVDVLAGVGGTNHDGYLDLVNFQVGGLSDNTAIKLEVSLANGYTRMKNATGAPVSIEYYEVTSPGGALNLAGWNSLQDQDFEGGGGFSGTGDGWEEGGGASANGLSESFLLGNSTLVNNQMVRLGNIFNPTGARDLAMRYGQADGLLIYGNVDYVANFGVDGDFDNNGSYGCTDVNSLTAAIASGANNASFDLTGDGLVNNQDLAAWLVEGGIAQLPVQRPYLIGDANLDGNVDGSDFGIWNSNKFTSNTEYCRGNFNADSVIDGSDFGIWNSNKFRSSDSGTLVPEPSSLLGIASVLGGWLTSRFRRRGR
jgi:hypothetical protein